MSEFKQLKYYFGAELGRLLAEKIKPHYPQFNSQSFIQEIEVAIDAQALKQRVETIADALQHQLPKNYGDAVSALHKILGPENRNETGMFTEWYWLMPVAFFVEKYGLDDYAASIQLIEEITKRNTGEYAIRPFLLAQPKETLAIALTWSQHNNFHVRRLASEGLRPRLPWAKKITLFSQDPSPVIAVLENLKADPSAYVRKSVANNLADFLKENYAYTIKVLEKWAVNANKETRWIIKHALRNEIKKENPIALQLVNSLKPS
jgi:3-methyladenine DNA glycosylase AlkC